MFLFLISSDAFRGGQDDGRMKRPLPHKCLHCKEFFLSDYRNRRHQKYCSKEACQRESHRRAQAKYRVTPKGRRDETKKDVAERMRKSRARRRDARAAEAAVLRDDCNPEVVEREEDKGYRVMLRDDCLDQNPLIIGLISQFSGVLRDDIAPVLKSLHSRGQMILGKGPWVVNQTEGSDGDEGGEAGIVRGTGKACAGAV